MPHFAVLGSFHFQLKLKTNKKTRERRWFAIPLLGKRAKSKPSCSSVGRGGGQARPRGVAAGRAPADHPPPCDFPYALHPIQVPPRCTAAAAGSSKLPPGAHGVRRGCRTRGTSLGILRALPHLPTPPRSLLLSQYNTALSRLVCCRNFAFAGFTLGRHAVRVQPLHPGIRLLLGPKAGEMGINKNCRMITLLLHPQHQWEKCPCGIALSIAPYSICSTLTTGSPDPCPLLWLCCGGLEAACSFALSQFLHLGHVTFPKRINYTHKKQWVFIPVGNCALRAPILQPSSCKQFFSTTLVDTSDAFTNARCKMVFKTNCTIHAVPQPGLLNWN